MFEIEGLIPLDKTLGLRKLGMYGFVVILLRKVVGLWVSSSLVLQIWIVASVLIWYERYTRHGHESDGLTIISLIHHLNS